MRVIKCAAWVLAALVLASCGGASGPSPYNSGSGGSPTPGAGGGAGTTTASMAITLSTSTVTAATPATVTATLRDSSGNAAAGQVVTFSVSGGLGVVSPTSALTNNSGQAVTTLSPSNASVIGAGEVTASATVNGAAASAKQGFSLSATSVTISNFTSGLAVGTALSAYGRTTLTVALAGTVPNASVTVNVSSACVTANKARLAASSVTTTTGSATFTYDDLGCGAGGNPSDSLQASVTGTASTQALTIALSSPAVSSITFISATPETIFLKGSGFAEQAVVAFKVVDGSGNGVPSQSVSMAATTYTGGLTLDGVATPVVKNTDSNGNVTVLVNSGTVPTPVRVRATTQATPSSTISTSSSALSISVGLPTQNAFSLSQKTFNIEGFDLDGISNTYTIIASDRMSNPVPDGTSINFVAEGGQITTSSQISLSPLGIASATVNFVSASPKPADGRITVVAYALGEESFVDTNGNNVHDVGEEFQDLGDVFVSRSFIATGVFDPNDQRIPQTLTGTAAPCVNISTATPAAAQLALSRFVPSAPTDPLGSRCNGAWGQAIVRRAAETVLSTSASDPVFEKGIVSNGGSVNLRDTSDPLVAAATYYRVGGSRISGMGTRGSLYFLVRDVNPVRLNPVAAGSTIAVAATTGLTVRVTGGSPVISTTEATLASISYEFAATATDGTITLSIASPSGRTTAVGLDICSGACPP
jgi:Bacterial Ig-like domain (group 1)